jgi:hypothetical protein
MRGKILGILLCAFVLVVVFVAYTATGMISATEQPIQAIPLESRPPALEPELCNVELFVGDGPRPAWLAAPERSAL